MSERIAVSGTAPVFIGATGPEDAGIVVFQVGSASSLAMDVQTRVNGSDEALGDSAYFNLRANPRTIVAAGTDVTANGIYAVIAPGCEVWLTPTTGTCTVDVVRVSGTL